MQLSPRTGVSLSTTILHIQLYITILKCPFQNVPMLQELQCFQNVANTAETIKRLQTLQCFQNVANVAVLKKCGCSKDLEDVASVAKTLKTLQVCRTYKMLQIFCSAFIMLQILPRP